MRHLEIKLDHLPPRELSPNTREHWTVVKDFKSVARFEAGYLAKVKWQEQEPMKKAKVHYHFMVKDKRDHDVDNLVASCKAYLDGLIDVNVIMSDSYKYLSIGSAKVDYGDEYHTIIKIKEVK
jgi:hypothetical protein